MNLRGRWTGRLGELEICLSFATWSLPGYCRFAPRQQNNYSLTSPHPRYARRRIAREFNRGMSECGLVCRPEILAIDAGLNNEYGRLGVKMGDKGNMRFPCG